MKIDSHQHFWDYTAHPQDYVWMDGGAAALRRNFGPADLAPLLAAAGYDGTVAVQAREMTAETDDLLAIATACPLVKGVVGWIDLCAPDVERALDRYAAEPRLKGLRTLIHDRPDPDFAASDAHVRGVSLLARYGLTYDLLLKPEHLAAATRLVDALPDQPFVVDHMAKPDLRGTDRGTWLAGMSEIARRPNVWCKLSGAATFPGAAADWREAVTPYLAAMVDWFGPDRCMIGSDWPVCSLAADFASVTGAIEDWCAQLTEAERSRILGGTCAAFYGLDGSPGDASGVTPSAVTGTAMRPETKPRPMADRHPSDGPVLSGRA
ncbi:amidohydrolase family protein [Sphingomonas sp. CLY1604]|uniref:amidohydrolase family protein n=1 Tax=Sphingomonas sp. CLY1604 TaxID=3457786 RepID=UPI003FD8C9CC